MMTKRLEAKKVNFHIDIEVTHMVHDQIGFDVAKESKLFASWSNGDGTFTHHQVPCGDVTCSVCLSFATPKSMKDIYEQGTSSRNEIARFPIENGLDALTVQSLNEAWDDVIKSDDNEFKCPIVSENDNSKFTPEEYKETYVEEDVEMLEEGFPCEDISKSLRTVGMKASDDGTNLKNNLMKVHKLMKENKIKIDTSKIRPFLNSIKAIGSSSYHQAKAFEHAIKNFDVDPYQRRAEREGITREEAKRKTYEEHFQVRAIHQEVNGKVFEQAVFDDEIPKRTWKDKMNEFQSRPRTGRFKAKQEDVLGRKLGVQMFRYLKNGKRDEMLECLNKEDEALIKKLQMMKPKEVLKHKGKEILCSSRIKPYQGKRYKEIFEHFYNDEGKRYGWNITYYEVVEE